MMMMMNNFYKCARIFVIFDTQLFGLILIIPVNLLRTAHSVLVDVQLFLMNDKLTYSVIMKIKSNTTNKDLP